MMDVKSIPDYRAGKPRRKMLLVIDEASSLLGAKVLKSETSQDIKDAFEEIWRRPYKMPAVVHFDSAKYFSQGVMGKMWSDAQVHVDQAAGEAHWQVGKVGASRGLV